MLGKIYSILFFLALGSAIMVQHVYLKKSILELNERKQNKNLVIPILSAHNFQANDFQRSQLKSTFSADNLVYYSSKKIIATGNIVFVKVSKNPKKNLLIKSEVLQGQLINHLDKFNGYFNNNKLKSVLFPEEVLFFEEKNEGKAQNVIYNVDKQTIQSNQWVESWGPMGKLKAKGFLYSLKNDDFTLDTRVSGFWDPKPKTKE